MQPFSVFLRSYFSSYRIADSAVSQNSSSTKKKCLLQLRACRCRYTEARAVWRNAIRRRTEMSSGHASNWLSAFLLGHSRSLHLIYSPKDARGAVQHCTTARLVPLVLHPTCTVQSKMHLIRVTSSSMIWRIPLPGYSSVSERSRLQCDMRG